MLNLHTMQDYPEYSNVIRTVFHAVLAHGRHSVNVIIFKNIMWWEDQGDDNYIHTKVNCLCVPLLECRRNKKHNRVKIEDLGDLKEHMYNNRDGANGIQC